MEKIPWRRKWQPTPVFLPGESHGQRSLAGCSPQGRKESDAAERLNMYPCTCPPKPPFSPCGGPMACPSVTSSCQGTQEQTVVIVAEARSVWYPSVTGWTVLGGPQIPG